MKTIANAIKSQYYQYQPGEFLPVRIDGKISNMRAFHAYRIKWIMNNCRTFLYQLTHQPD